MRKDVVLRTKERMKISIKNDDDVDNFILLRKQFIKLNAIAIIAPYLCMCACQYCVLFFKKRLSPNAVIARRTARECDVYIRKRKLFK